MFDFSLLMLKYYVDDGNIISTTFPPGARLCEDGVIRVLDNMIEVDRQTPADQRTALLVCEVGNTISNFIRLTVDYPSKHSNGFMPLLDLQVAMCNNKVIYKFYSKPMSSPYVILSNSAMPDKVKRNCLVQECLRRLRNTSRSLDWTLKAEILSDFSNKMRVSGYCARYRLEIVQPAVRG